MSKSIHHMSETNAISKVRNHTQDNIIWKKSNNWGTTTKVLKQQQISIIWQQMSTSIPQRSKKIAILK